MADEANINSLFSRVRKAGVYLTSSPLLLIMAIVILFWSEAKYDLLNLAKTAVEINSQNIDANASFDGRLISTTGIIVTDNEISDDLFLKPDKYVVINRKVEMYAWVDDTISESSASSRNSRETNNNSIYKMWTEDPKSPSEFQYPEGHINPEKSISSRSFTASARVGNYLLDVSRIEIPHSLEPLILSPQNTTPDKATFITNDGSHIFIRKNDASSLKTPELGDLRISYTFMSSGKLITIFGKLNGTNITEYNDQSNKLYRIFYGTRDEAIKKLQSETRFFIWGSRIFGFFAMWAALAMLFWSLNIVRGGVPIFGSIEGRTTAIVTFIVSLIFSIDTVLVSAFFHNETVLFISFIIIYFALKAFVLFNRKRVE